MADTVEITVTEIEGKAVTFSNLPRVLREKYGMEIVGMRFSDDGKSVKAEGRMIPSKPLVVETFAQYPPLGRFTVKFAEIEALL
ncbi:hypothetical protein [Pseudomonas sp. RT6P73]